MDRRTFIKSLATIPFLGFLKPEIPISQPLARLDLIAEGLKASGNDLLKQTKPVVEEMAKQTIYFTPYPNNKVVYWNGEIWNTLQENDRPFVYFEGLDDYITTGHKS